MQRFLYLTESETQPTAFTIKDDAGAVIDLTPFATTKALVRYNTGTSISVTCAVTSAADGTITIPWTSSQLIRGTHEMTFELATAGGLKQFVPSQYTVSLVVRANIEVA